MMKRVPSILISVLISVTTVFPLHGKEEDSASPGGTSISVNEPMAVLENGTFQFSPVIDGVTVTHEFIILNKGEADLALSDIKTGCGCTTADYTKTIPPGGKGKVIINGNTTGYGGKRFSRNIIVTTNDPKSPQLSLHMSGPVENFALIQPAQAVLRGSVGEEMITSIAISSVEKYPFQITDVSLDKALREKVSISRDTKDGKTILVVKNLEKNPGRYRGRIHLKTDSPVKPELSIIVSGLVSEKK